MSNNLNEKNFTLTLNNIRNFTIKIINFVTTTSLSILINLSLSVSTIPHLRTRMSSSLGINKIDFSFLPKITTRVLSSLGISKINITTIMKVINREESVINMFLPFVFNLKRNLRGIASINEQKLNLSFTPTVGQFNTLSYIDASGTRLLSDLDGAVLSDLEFA